MESIYIVFFHIFVLKALWYSSRTFGEPKCTKIWSEKVLDLSHFGPIWPTLGTNLTSVFLSDWDEETEYSDLSIVISVCIVKQWSIFSTLKLIKQAKMVFYIKSVDGYHSKSRFVCLHLWSVGWHSLLSPIVCVGVWFPGITVLLWIYRQAWPCWNSMMVGKQGQLKDQLYGWK